MIKTVSQISPETDSAKRFEVIYCKFWFQKLMLHLAHAEITQSHEVIRHYAGSHTYVFGYMQVVTSTYLTLYRQSYLHFSHYVGNHTFVINFKSFVQFLEFYLVFGKMFTLIRPQILASGQIFIVVNGQSLKIIQPSGHTAAGIMLIYIHCDQIGRSILAIFWRQIFYKSSQK